MNNRQLISILVPCYNEEEVLPAFFKRVITVIHNIDEYDFEVLIIDDGSVDATWNIIVDWQKRYSQIRGIRLSRNFGHQAALSCAHIYAQGEAAISIDADLQDPPELFPEMLEQWKAGYDVVYMVRQEREGESAFKLISAKIFYDILNKLSGDIQFVSNCGDFRLMSKRACVKLTEMRNLSRIFEEW